MNMLEITIKSILRNIKTYTTMNLKKLIKVKDGYNYYAVYVANYPTREFGKEGRAERVFKTKSEAYKFVEDYEKKYWWAKNGCIVEQRTIDNRNAYDKGLSNQAYNVLEKSLQKNNTNWRMPF